MSLIYDLIIFIYALVYFPYLLLTKRGYPGYGMRFGFFPSALSKQIKGDSNIWIHAVSVGEVMVLEGFIDLLKKNYPDHQLVVSVTTKTGYKLACERLKGKASVIPSPIDFSFVARRFITLIQPKLYIVVETEIWPNLYRQLFVRKIPVVVINGRISGNSFGRYKMIRFMLKKTLNQVQLWCMQSPRDADRIKDLGAESSRVIVTGNLKFDQYSFSQESSQAHFIQNKDECWWVAGSTHPGEEEILLDVYGKMIKENPQWRLVIVPRHVERSPQIIELINKRGLKAIKQSDIQSAHPFEEESEKAVIVVDTIGQLRSLYALASLVFVGKTFCVGGGQNMIEPAFYGKAIIIGPSVENFRDIVACFKENKAIVQVEDVPSFEAAVRDLVRDPLRREALGEAAKEVIAKNQGASKRNLEHLAGILK